jgi:hypothetical protein
MIAIMKRIGEKLRGLNTMCRMQWMLSMLAIIGCLWSVAGIHSHDDGLHALESACISCDLEDITSHGAAAAAMQCSKSNISHNEPVVSPAAFIIAVRSATAPIRAPPSYS